jgi:hypothetical protein
MNRNAVGTVSSNSVQEDRSWENTACTKMHRGYGPVAERSLMC